MRLDEDCPGCRERIRHDHRDHGDGFGVDCVHARSSGELRSCCCDVLAQEVGMRKAARQLANGGGPRTPAELLFDDEFERDPVGAVFRLAAAEEWPPGDVERP